MAKITIEYYKELLRKIFFGEITQKELVELLNEKASEPEPQNIAPPKQDSCECENVETFEGWSNEKCFRCKDCNRTW